MLLVFGMCLAQVSTMIATLYTTRSAVISNVKSDIQVAESIFQELIEQRYFQLSQSVSVLADDFGFKSAVTSQDSATIKSALTNHGSRAGANLAAFISSDGKVKAHTLKTQGEEHNANWYRIITQVVEQDYILTVESIDAVQYQIVSVPVMAPNKIGWLVMGFAINKQLAEDIKSISGLEVSLLHIQNNQQQVTVSTLPENELVALSALLSNKDINTDDQQEVLQWELADDLYLTSHSLVVPDNADVIALLQKSLAEELRPFARLEKNLVFLFIGALLLAATSGVYTVRRMLKPITQLTEAANRIGEGNYGVNVTLDTKDELGKLGETLNSMQFDIAEREYRIIHQSQHDDLTGLPNRYLVQDRIESAIQRAERSNAPFTLILIDIVRFQQINDTLGHHIGDVMLQECAQRLASRMRKSDTAARLGGDDFLLILENTSIKAALHLAENALRKQLSAEITLEDIHVNLDFSFGLAEYPSHGDTAASLLRRSEIALYDAKEHHTKLAVYENGRDEAHHRQLAIVSSLDEALNEPQFNLFYQPKIDLADGSIKNAEALIRWIHPQFGFMPPDEFITVLEQTGNITQLTKWVVYNACAQCREWLDAGMDIKISINLSTLDLLNESFPVYLLDVLKDFQLPTSHIVLEVTESAIIRDASLAIRILGNLKDHGFTISIDDFGTGYSSLAQLKQLPVDELKIDKSFVLDLKEDSEDAVIVSSTVHLARSMNLSITAEGVETLDSAELLKSLGCDKGQGYYFSKPVTAKEFETWYRSHNGIYQLNQQQVA